MLYVQTISVHIQGFNLIHDFMVTFKIANLGSLLTACRKEFDVLIACRKDAQPSFPVPPTGPYRLELEDPTLTNRLAASRNY